MPNRPKSQHFVPQFNLVEFTHERRSNGKLYVLDKQEGRQWTSSPQNAAKELDFYTGNFGPEAGPYDVEIALSRCEGKWAAVTQNVIDSSALPPADTEEFADLMGFVAFQAMRGPSTRKYVADLYHEFWRRELTNFLSSEVQWSRFAEFMKSLGQPLTFTRNEALETASHEDYFIELDKTSKIQQQITTSINLMVPLAAREWSLFIPEQDAPDFVCSDSPVCVTSVDGSTDRSHGFWQPQSVITVALGRRHALAGFFEGRLEMQLPPNEVAGLNFMTIEHARWVYSADLKFVVLRPDRTIGDASDLLNPTVTNAK